MFVQKVRLYKVSVTLNLQGYRAYSIKRPQDVSMRHPQYVSIGCSKDVRAFELHPIWTFELDFSGTNDTDVFRRPNKTFCGRPVIDDPSFQDPTRFITDLLPINK